MIDSNGVHHSRLPFPFSPLEVISERLGLVDGLLLAFRVVRIDLRWLGVTSGLAAAEALATFRHDDVGNVGAGHGRHDILER